MDRKGIAWCKVGAGFPALAPHPRLSASPLHRCIGPPPPGSVRGPFLLLPRHPLMSTCITGLSALNCNSLFTYFPGKLE